MDAKATAHYLTRRITDAVKDAGEWRGQLAESLSAPLVRGSRMTSAHLLERVTTAEAIAVAWLEISEVAGGTLEEVGHDAFLDAVRKVRGEITHWLRTSRHENTGASQLQALAQHNAATKVLAGTDIIEIIDPPEGVDVAGALAEVREITDQLRGDRGGSKGARLAALVDVLDKAGVITGG